MGPVTALVGRSRNGLIVLCDVGDRTPCVFGFAPEWEGSCSCPCTFSVDEIGGTGGVGACSLARSRRPHELRWRSFLDDMAQWNEENPSRSCKIDNSLRYVVAGMLQLNIAFLGPNS